MIGFVFAWIIIIAVVVFALLAIAPVLLIADWLMEKITGIGLFEIAKDAFCFLLDKITGATAERR